MYRAGCPAHSTQMDGSKEVRSERTAGKPPKKIHFLLSAWVRPGNSLPCLAHWRQWWGRGCRDAPTSYSLIHCTSQIFPIPASLNAVSFGVLETVDTEVDPWASSIMVQMCRAKLGALIPLGLSNGTGGSQPWAWSSAEIIRKSVKLPPCP